MQGSREALSKAGPLLDFQELAPLLLSLWVAIGMVGLEAGPEPSEEDTGSCRAGRSITPGLGSNLTHPGLKPGRLQSPGFCSPPGSGPLQMKGPSAVERALGRGGAV